ncbi:MAG: hypothetical protein LBS00_09180 [Synergistaceae bacterium]|jgi:hypothetical protein|nr:hypothetical protein [Synergistaceae bacterium]
MKEHGGKGKRFFFSFFNFFCRIFGSWSLTGLAVLALMGAGAAGAAEPLLVVQPSYVGMQFYVSQPQGLPPHWYTTFDGYPVWKNADGIWLYGSFSGSELIPTNYVVGSVVPSIVGLVPYAVQTVPVQTAPVHVTQVQAAPARFTPIQFTPVQATPVQAAPVQVRTFPAPQVTVAVPVPVVPAPVYAVPAWALDPHFMALGEWRKNVDRVGILFKPAIPIAWKGHLPQVIYAWTGNRWYQMVRREGERPGDVLRNNLYLLTRLVNRNRAPAWHGTDALFLANQTAQWGYTWMGSVTPVLPLLSY